MHSRKWPPNSVFHFTSTAHSALWAFLRRNWKPACIRASVAPTASPDFHKWAQVPYDAGFLADGYWLRDAFSTHAAYLTRTTRGIAGGEWWPCDLGTDLSRGFRALKTWMTIRTYGL